MELEVAAISSATASRVVVAEHYLHRRPPISAAFGLYRGMEIVGVVTFGAPASRHLQMSACPTDPSRVLELNRLWVSDEMPKNTESWFVSRALSLLPPSIVVSYADTKEGHYGYIYRALNFHYSGVSDMDRKSPRFDYAPLVENGHSRSNTRVGHSGVKVPRQPKVKYWTATGNRSDRRQLEAMCAWPKLDWKQVQPPRQSTPTQEERMEK